jgi:hypothetical protein
MRIYLRWDGYPLDMTLRDPAGRLRTTEAPGPNAEYLELGFADFASYVITDTLPGAWELTLSSPQTSVAPSRYVVYAEWPDSNVQLEAVATPWVDPSVAATITATVRGPADLTVDEVYAELFTPYGHYTSVLQPAIPARGQDGLVFTGTAEMPMPGYYSLLVTARGTVGERAFERGAYANLGVRSDGAHLLNDAALHTAALPDGRTGLVADIGVEVRTEGDYMLSALLVRADTRASVRVAHPLHLQPGVERVPVAFDALPYTPGVTYWLEVALLDISGAALPVDAITNAALLPATP